jgi:hypothetical protein
MVGNIDQWEEGNACIYERTLAKLMKSFLWTGAENQAPPALFIHRWKNFSVAARWCDFLSRKVV